MFDDVFYLWKYAVICSSDEVQFIWKLTEAELYEEIMFEVGDHLKGVTIDMLKEGYIFKGNPRSINPRVLVRIFGSPQSLYAFLRMRGFDMLDEMKSVDGKDKLDEFFTVLEEMLTEF